MERTESSKFIIGSKLPQFSLISTAGQSFGTEQLRQGRAALVVFSCNHCPYVKGSESFLIETAKEFAPLGLVTVAINSNDPIKYPDDSFAEMKKKILPYPYLFDETQEVAKLFDAQCTPECYLFNSKQELVYHGRITDTPRDAQAVKVNHLREAVKQLLEQGSCDPSYVHPVGCSIKWK
jgi:peroxiredoxin